MNDFPRQFSGDIPDGVDEVDDDDYDEEMGTYNNGDDDAIFKDDQPQSSMDFSFAIGLSRIGSEVLKLQTEDGDLMSYYGKRSGSKSISERKQSTDWAQNDGEECGQPYYLHDSSEALNRFSGGLKYNGRWSATMSDIFGADPSASTSNGMISLMIPELGALRGSYSNSVSPLGITLTTPSPSPRTALGSTHRGFMSPHQSIS